MMRLCRRGEVGPKRIFTASSGLGGVETRLGPQRCLVMGVSQVRLNSKCRVAVLRTKRR